MLAKGSHVSWKDQNQERNGKVQELYPQEVEMTLFDGKLSCKGSPQDQALFILDENGNKYLKLESEVEKKQ